MKDRPDIEWEDLSQIAKTRCYKYLNDSSLDLPQSHVVQIANLKARCSIIDYLRPVASINAEQKVIAERISSAPKRGGVITQSIKNERFDSRRNLLNFLAAMGDVAARVAPRLKNHMALSPRSMCVMYCLRNYLKLSLRETVSYANTDPAIKELLRGRVPSLDSLNKWEYRWSAALPVMADMALKQIREEAKDGDTANTES